MRRTLLSLFILVGTIAVATAQTGNISGKILMENKEPAAGAVVYIKSLNKESIVDETGSYTLKNIPYGKYTLEVGSIAIVGKKTDVTVNRPETTFHVSVVAKESKTLNEVNINGKTVKKEIETSGFAVAIVETKEASLRNLTTNELLDRAVGVRVRQNGGIGASIEYNLNGMSGSAIGIFIDGTSIATFGRSFNLNNIPPSMIERIEVYKGVLPAHLTGDYVGGAINVIMKKDASANNITAAASFGSFHTYQSDISMLYRDQKTGFTTRAFGAYTATANNYEMWGKFVPYTDVQQRITRYHRFKRFNNDYEAYSGRVETGFTNVKWADNVFLGYNFSKEFREIPHGTTMAQPYVGRFERNHAHIISLNYMKNNFLAEGLALNVNAVHSNRSTYLQDTNRVVYNWDGNPLRRILNSREQILVKPVGQGQQGTAVISQIDRNIINVRSNLAYTVIPNHKISLNHSLNRADREDTDLLDQRKKDFATTNILTTHILAVNYEAQTFKNKLLTNLLVKYNYNQNRQNKASIQTNAGVNSIIFTESTSVNKNPGYAATVSYNIIPKLSIIGSTENMYVSPTEEQLFGNPERNLLENLSLKAEKNINYNLSVRYGVLTSGRHSVSIYGSAFWREGFDRIATQAVDSIIPGRESDANIQTTKFINIGRTQSRGFEGEVTYVYNKRLNMVANFSKFNTLNKTRLDEAGRPNKFYNEQLPNEPFFTINGTAQYRFNNVFQKNAVFNVYYTTGYVAPFKTNWLPTDEFTTSTQYFHDIGGSYRFPSGKLIASLDIKNIFNSEMYDNFAVQKPGRGIYLKLNYTINNFNK